MQCGSSQTWNATYWIIPLIMPSEKAYTVWKVLLGSSMKVGFTYKVVWEQKCWCNEGVLSISLYIYKVFPDKPPFKFIFSRKWLN